MKRKGYLLSKRNDETKFYWKVQITKGTLKYTH